MSDDRIYTQADLEAAVSVVRAEVEQWRQANAASVADECRQHRRAESAEADLRALREGLEALAHHWANDPHALAGIGNVGEVAAHDLRALLAPSPAEGTDEAGRTSTRVIARAAAEGHCTSHLEFEGSCLWCGISRDNLIRATDPAPVVRPQRRGDHAMSPEEIRNTLDDDADLTRSDTTLWRDRGQIIAAQQTRIAQLEAQIASAEGSLRDAAALGWDAAVAAMVYDDGTPVEVTRSTNPYRTKDNHEVTP